MNISEVVHMIVKVLKVSKFKISKLKSVSKYLVSKFRTQGNNFESKSKLCLTCLKISENVYLTVRIVIG